eukprot:TRINITY_DN2651_c0_g1_i1.p1 TRINITY_DN2651_c0_g1~~TRINITY_DN2651_c0_g1_i1.p1  ORF type:complete len:377 (-),score=83.55 TRINITY_DN2651_c0_g1_i1:12-1142(-)
MSNNNNDSDNNKMDMKKVKDFGSIFVKDISSAFLCIQLAIGQELDLFTHMSDFGTSFSTEELAEKSSCNLRYIQEWLSDMSAAEYTLYDPATKKYIFPIEHAVFFINKETNPFMSSSIINTLQPFYSNIPKYVESFRSGVGLKLSDISPNIGDLIADITYQSMKFKVNGWIENFLPEVHELFTSDPINTINVVDVGCGEAIALISIANKFNHPNIKYYGIEPHYPSFLRAQANIAEANLMNSITMINDTSQALSNGERKYDVAFSFDVVHDCVDPEGFVQDIYNSLSDTGIYIMNEILCSSKLEENYNRSCVLIYSLSILYCMSVSLAEGGRGIGACMGEEVTKQICSKAGFKFFEKVDTNEVLLYRIKKINPSKI